MKSGKFLKEYAVWILLLITLAMAAYGWWQDNHQPDTLDGSDLLADKVKSSSRSLPIIANNKQDIKEATVSQPLFQRHLYMSQADLFASPNAVEDRLVAANTPAPTPVVTSVPIIQPPIPAPTAPPLPFTYVGKLIQDGKLAVFVGMQGRDMLIKKDETIAQIYHIDDISQTEVKMTYIPLQIQQILKLESLN